MEPGGDEPSDVGAPELSGQRTSAQSRKIDLAVKRAVFGEVEKREVVEDAPPDCLVIATVFNDYQDLVYRKISPSAWR